VAKWYFEEILLDMQKKNLMYLTSVVIGYLSTTVTVSFGQQTGVEVIPWYIVF